jgi:hypothetical protein
LSHLTGMLFTLSVGLHNVPLAPEDVAKASPAYQVQTETTQVVSYHSSTTLLLLPSIKHTQRLNF